MLRALFVKTERLRSQMIVEVIYSKTEITNGKVVGYIHLKTLIFSCIPFHTVVHCNNFSSSESANLLSTSL